MPWYHIYADHGPGHQSHTQFYQWYDEKLSRQEARDQFEAIFADKRWPVGHVTLLQKLPIDVLISKRQELVRQLRATKQHTKKMLKILDETRPSRCIHQYVKSFTHEKFGPGVQCTHCDKVRLYGRKRWIRKLKGLP